MKSIKHLLIAVVLLVPLSCSDLDLLDNPNAVTPDKADTELFFNSVQLDFAAFYNNASNLGMPIPRMAHGFFNIYDNLYSPQSFNFIWNVAYAGMLPDMDALIEKATDLDLWVHVGATKVMKAYVLFTLVDYFGAVPYSEALGGLENPSPAADSDTEVYAAAFAILQEAVADLAKSASGTPSVDIFYGGSASKWSKVANSLMLRYYLNMKDASGINSVVNDVIQSSGDDFQFRYGKQRNNPDSRHPYYASHYETGSGRYMSNYFMWSMRGESGSGKDLPDPRLRYYFYRQDIDPSNEDQFTLDCVALPKPLHYQPWQPWCLATNQIPGDTDASEGYWGRDQGNDDGIPPDGSKRTNFGIYPAGGKFDTGQGGSLKNKGTDGAGGNGIAPIMLSSFVAFMRAEAALTLGTNDNARDMLSEGIRTSIDKVITFSASIGNVDASLVPNDSEIEAYVTMVLSSYDAADNDGKLDIVAKEYILALWGNGYEAYNLYRRTGKPANMQPTREADFGIFPHLFFYPADYVNLNAKASQRVISETVFWDPGLSLN